ncbi:YifB family Mg chelatase-like AAA ATPase [Aquibacillus halophilus]|uniref:YifB family Mg chelatase-like AAA ATPase n=1 Tax=Aquibacillus halophilus TaxID=930132 RepID=UPI001F108E83|nr:ATP-binding protein [Aquibacillus halophilus]
MLPAVLAAQKEGFSILYLPWIDNFPLKQMKGIELRFVRSLSDVIESFSGQLTAFSFDSFSMSVASYPPIITYDKDFKSIIGHRKEKKALEIAAAGGHHVLMSGPPGCGRSLLAETVPSILPLLTQDAQYEVMSIYQLSGLINQNYHLAPFRNPHHSSSAVSLIGGGSNPKPGEVSLAHCGVLFLDEMAEFPKRTLDMLRQPIETGKVTISRAASTVTYPARFLMLGAMNPCPSRNLGSRHLYCTCTPKQITAYSNRVSGPIQDRMDIIINLQSESLDGKSHEENEASQSIRTRVSSARQKQYDRYGSDITNAIASPELIMESCELDLDQQKMLQQWSSKYNWSTRVQMKIRRIALTISDLNESKVTSEALWEAMTMRCTNQENKSKTMVR